MKKISYFALTVLVMLAAPALSYEGTYGPTRIMSSFTDEDGMPYIVEAAYDGDIHEVRSQLNNHANINAQDPDGRTALIAATESNYVEIVDLLLKKGADVTLTNKKGEDALAVATKNKHTRAIKLLTPYVEKKKKAAAPRQAPAGNKAPAKD